MFTQVKRTAILFIVLLSSTGAGALFADGVHDNRLKLWEIVHDQCVPAEKKGQNPLPCVKVDLTDENKGYAILPDRNGVAQFLMIPTRRITGIESPIILEQDSSDYWRAAWEARRNVFAKLHKTLPRDAIGMAINSAVSRSQDQLHIHVDCVAPEVREQLQQHLTEIGDGWAKLDFDLMGRRYQAMRVENSDLQGSNPFTSLATGLKIEASDMGKETLVVIGATFGPHKDGFIYLEDHAGSVIGDTGHGEDLLDPSCMIATAGPM